jgi:FkbM family methyltransferase
MNRVADLMLRSDTLRYLLSTKDPRFSEIGHAVVTFLAAADDRDALAFRDILARSGESMAASLQDVWVLVETANKRNGFFVEFGATDGIEGSNTLLLESRYGWQGILCEPNPVWLDSLRRNRKAAVDPRCVMGRSGQSIRFVATDIAALSHAEELSPDDAYRDARRDSAVVEIESVSLHDLLLAHDAPRPPNKIDFISIDTEGAELEILTSFDMSAWLIDLFCVEHNHTDREAQIDELMAANGYERRFRGISRQDAWYRRIQ